jgi:hypothetical protein
VNCGGIHVPSCLTKVCSVPETEQFLHQVRLKRLLHYGQALRVWIWHGQPTEARYKRIIARCQRDPHAYDTVRKP